MDDSLQIWLCLLHVNRCLPPRPSIHDCCMWTGACLRPSIHDCVCCVCTGARPCDLCANRCPPPDIIHPWLSVMWTGACSRPWLCVVCGEVHAPIRDCVCCVCIVWTGACRQTSSIRDCVCFVWTGARLQTSSIRDCVFCVNSVSVLREQVPTPKPHPSVTHSLCVLCVNRCQPPNLIHLWLTVYCEQVPAHLIHLCLTVCTVCEQVPAPKPHPSATYWLCVLCVWTGARPQTSSICDSLTVCTVWTGARPQTSHWLCVLCVWTGACPQTSSIHDSLTVCIVCVNRRPPPDLIHPGEAERAAGVTRGAEDQEAAAGCHRGWAGVSPQGSWQVSLQIPLLSLSISSSPLCF